MAAGRPLGKLQMAISESVQKRASLADPDSPIGGATLLYLPLLSPPFPFPPASLPPFPPSP